MKDNEITVVYDDEKEQQVVHSHRRHSLGCTQVCDVSDFSGPEALRPLSSTHLLRHPSWPSLHIIIVIIIIVSIVVTVLLALHFWLLQVPLSVSCVVYMTFARRRCTMSMQLAVAVLIGTTA